MPDIPGTTGNDTITGTTGSDIIAGLTGDDVISGGNGNDTLDGGDGDDALSGGNGQDTLAGGNGNDVLHGNNGIDHLLGGAGNDSLFGDNGNDYLTGGAGDDLIDGNNGFDTVYYAGNIDRYTFFAAAGYLHVVHLGGAGADGHDRAIRVEKLVFADRDVDLTGATNNRPVAVDDHVAIGEDDGPYASGAAGVLVNDFDFEGQALGVTPGTTTGAWGTLTLAANGSFTYAPLAAVEALAAGETVVDSFVYTVSDGTGSDTATLDVTITGRNDAPVAAADTGEADENGPAVSIDVLANDSDVDNGAILTLVAASVPAGLGTASIVGNLLSYNPGGGDFEALAVGESANVTIAYTIEDEHGATASSTVTVTVAGTNDAPTAARDTAEGGENEVLLIDAAANDGDVDNDAVLGVTGASAPQGQGSASAAGGLLRFDPGTDFDDLALGESEQVVVSYVVADEHGATSASTVTITVVGANDAPVAVADARTTGRETAVVVDVLANDIDVDEQPVLTVVAASGPPGRGEVTIVEDQIRFDPGSDFDDLAPGESVSVVIDYTIADEHGETSSSTLTVTVRGSAGAGGTTGTDRSETLVGGDEDDIVDARGGDDIVFAGAGNDLVGGGDGRDQLLGEDGDDEIDGGSDNDLLSGGAGNDALAGGTGNDNASGGDGDDNALGGAGLDHLAGDAGDDVLAGGADDDFLSGDEGHDRLSGDDGVDILDGGEGDDVLAGGAGADVLLGRVGANQLAGGAGDDVLLADAVDGDQALDGGDGNDLLQLSWRQQASTIVTGLGRDTIQLAYANVGEAAIVVTDFHSGRAGDVLRLTGYDGAPLDLLEGWNGKTDPFDTGFLQLEQSEADTLLQWDRDGSGDQFGWETLVTFRGRLADTFTLADFGLAFDPAPDPTGATIGGTPEEDVLTGTAGADTIDALGGSDVVFGGDGADIVRGGGGFDNLNGDGGDDVVSGGSEDDILAGGDGNDQLSGDADADVLSGEEGHDSLAGGAGDDGLLGGEGDDSLSGGDGDDVLIGDAGEDRLTGGAGIDHFGFLSPDVGPDEITDFTAGTDQLRIRAEGFGGGLESGGSVSFVSGSEPAATEASGQFLYDSDDGRLLWDVDGTGSEEAVLLATFTGAPPLTTADFVVA